MTNIGMTLSLSLSLFSLSLSLSLSLTPSLTPSLSLSKTTTMPTANELEMTARLMMTTCGTTAYIAPEMLTGPYTQVRGEEGKGEEKMRRERRRGEEREGENLHRKICMCAVWGRNGKIGFGSPLDAPRSTRRTRTGTLERTRPHGHHRFYRS